MKFWNMLKIVILGVAITSLMSCQGGPQKKENTKKLSKRKVRKTSLAKKRKKRRGILNKQANDSGKYVPGSALGKTSEDAKNLENFAKNYTLKEQSQKTAAKFYYESAVKHHRGSRYRLAERDLLTCLKYDSSHRKAKALLHRIRYVLGDRRGAIHDTARDYIQDREIRVAQTKIEIERLFSRARLNYKQKNYKKSKAQFEKILELTRYFPFHVVEQSFLEGVRSWIRKTSRSKKKYDVELKRKLQEAAQEQARFLHAQNLKYISAQVRALYRQATLAFEQDEYDMVVEICDEILHLRPQFSKAQVLKQRSINAKHVKRSLQSFREQREHFARQMEEVDASAVPYQEVFRYPDRERWKVILNRASKVTSFDLGGNEQSAVEIDIHNRLKNLVISVNFRNTPFDDAIAFLRSASGLNFVVSNAAEEVTSDLKVSLSMDRVKLVSTLNQTLKVSQELTYKVKNGAVYITTKGTSKKIMIIHYYNVSDIINDLPNFPAPKLDLKISQGTGGGGGGGGLLPEDDGGGEATSGAGVDNEKLIELINKNIGESEDEGSVGITNGVLIVRKPLEAHKKIQILLQALRKSVGVMVTIEARFIDIQDNFLQEIGVDYRELPTIITNLDGAGTNQNVGYRRLSKNGNHDIRTALVNKFSQGLGTSSGNPFNMTSVGGLVMQYSKLSTFQLEAIFEAVKKKQRAKLVNAPRINVFNTQRAHVMAIHQRAYIKDIDSDAGGTVATLKPVMDVLNSGSVLDARPTVSYDRKYVTLEIRPTLAVDQTTEADTTTLQLGSGNTRIPIQLPVLTIQKIRTTVTVPDGGTILLGGLKNYSKQKKISGVPILSRIPILNTLVSRRGWSHLRRSLIILLSVKIHVIRDIEKRKFGGISLK